MHTKIVLLPHLTAMTLLFHVDVRLWPVKRWNKKSYVKQRETYTYSRTISKTWHCFVSWVQFIGWYNIHSTDISCLQHTYGKNWVIRVLSVAFIYSIYSIYKRLHQLTYAGELFHLFINFEMNPYEWFFLNFFFLYFFFLYFAICWFVTSNEFEQYFFFKCRLGCNIWKKINGRSQGSVKTGTFFKSSNLDGNQYFVYKIIYI